MKGGGGKRGESLGGRCGEKGALVPTPEGLSRGKKHRNHERVGLPENYESGQRSGEVLLGKTGGS